MTSYGLGEMFEGDFADTSGEKFPLVSMEDMRMMPVGSSGTILGFFWNLKIMHENRSLQSSHFDNEIEKENVFRIISFNNKMMNKQQIYCGSFSA